MRLPTISIAGLLLIVAILAVDMAAFESIRRARSWFVWEVETFLAVLPLLNILVIGLYLLGRQISLHGQATPFLVGFEATGVIALAVVLITQLGFGDQGQSYRVWAERNLWAFWHEYIEWTGQFTLEHADSIRVGFDLVAFSVPLVLWALIGGLFAKLAGVTVVRGQGIAPRPRAIPVRRARTALMVAALLLGAGIWAARVRGRWLEWRWFEQHELSGKQERYVRQDYNRLLAAIRELDRDSSKEFPFQRSGMIDRADSYRRDLKWFGERRRLYESTSHIMWLLFPPRPPELGD